MNRTVINPVPWSIQFGFNQGELVEHPSRILFLAGQTSLDAECAIQHAGDLAGQIDLSFDNIEAVLREADMTLANVARLVVYTTDVDAMLEHWDAFKARLDAAGARPVNTLLGVTRLAFPELMVELEATAVG